MVDTGGIYLVCNPRVATQMGLDVREAVSGLLSILLRGVLVQGRLYRVNLTLLAFEGENFTLEATAFVPESEDEESWGELPSPQRLPQARCPPLHVPLLERPQP